MKAPDKICIRKDDTAPFGFTRHWIYTTKVQGQDTEYIRKEALLEWVKANLQDRDNWNEKSAADAFCEVIDKLNSMQYMTQIKQIRKEIERMKEDVANGVTVVNGFSKLLSFIDTLERPQLHSDVEEAAEEYLEKTRRKFLTAPKYPDNKDVFIAGAEWAFSQGETSIEIVKGDDGDSDVGIPFLWPCLDIALELGQYRVGEEVIVQIRKKEKQQ